MKKLVLCLLVLVLLTGCSSQGVVSKKDQFKDIQASAENKQLGNIVLSLQPEGTTKRLPLVSKEQKESERVFTLMGITEKDVQEYAILTSQDDSEAYTVAIVKPAVGMEGNVINGLFSRITTLQEEFSENETQKTICDKSIFDQVGDYLVLVMTEDSKIDFQKVADAIVAIEVAKNEKK